MPKEKELENDIFSEDNILPSNWIKWGEVGDNVVGTLLTVREQPDNYAKKAGQMQKIYEIKASSGSFHNIVKKKVDKDATPIPAATICILGGRPGLDAQMRNIKIGQKIGIKFVEEKASKDPKNNDVKVIKVYAPKNPDGTALMDLEWLKEQETFNENNALPPLSN